MHVHVRILIFILIPAFLSACAVYHPASEAIIFHDQDEEPFGNNTRLIVPVGQSGVTLSAVFLPQPLRDGVRSNYEDRRFGEDGIEFREFYLNSPGLPTAAIPLARRAALGVSMVPLIPGFDTTVHLFSDNWLTATFQFPLGAHADTEIVFHRPVFRTEHGGITAGLFYRYERLSFFSDEESGVSFAGLFPSTFRMEWYGGRISGQLPDFAGPGRMRFHLHAGYSGTYSSMLFSAGVGFAIRSRPDRQRIEPVRYWD
jgi:hypothetical protein